MSRLPYRYRYTPRRRGSGRRSWWLALPAAAAVAMAAGVVSLVLAGDGGQSGGAAPCPSGQACASSPARAPDRSGALGGGAAGAAGTGLPSITGRAAAILEAPCGALLFGRSAHERLAPASLTKIATALVAVDRADLSATVTAQVSGGELAASTDSTIMGLEPGDTLSLRDLLYGMLLPSGNDAALAIAQDVGGSVPAFVEMMNQKAAELALADTHFANPHGLDDAGLYTSAYDIAVLGRELLVRPELAEMVRALQYQPAWSKPPVWNLNRLLTMYPGTLGVKVGYTDQAKQTIVAAAEREGRLLVVSVLGSTDIYSDAIALFDWAFDSAPPACGG